MPVILFDDEARHSLLPFTHTRPVADIRCGVFTMRERWERFLGISTATLTEPYLQEVFPLQSSEDDLLINGAVFATQALADAACELQPGEQLMSGDIIMAARTAGASLTFDTLPATLSALLPVAFTGAVNLLRQSWDIFMQNDRALRDDYAVLTAGRVSATVPDGVLVTGHNHLFIETGAIVRPGTIINTTTGPVYIAKGAEVMEGCLLRGPLAICEKATVNMGAKIYGCCTIGPSCKVGGELNSVILFNHSNKGHDGFLGHSVIGAWCNLGADTNCSNLKNNYDSVKIWDEHLHKSVHTGLTFCGLLMGDHSKCGINTMFNTGTVAGVSCNIYGAGFQDKFIPSFSWGSPGEMTAYDLNRALETAGRMMARRGMELSAAEETMYQHIYKRTQRGRDLMQRPASN